MRIQSNAWLLQYLDRLNTYKRLNPSQSRIALDRARIGLERVLEVEHDNVVAREALERIKQRK